ncbi:hypothetical protein LSH36_419g01014 [Paralvinella palmiformis]|uniref:Methyltransferase HEMK2 n=1 Tax=Paralvinella palmiformis TaxID=53620 RepID=A0AAD9N066_9ANNE|nr:hypothetical protein LSH36_419g01014 [Paralvinella palmiformis]
MIPTPDISHLTSVDYNEVYEPAEDTFLLLDALEQDGDTFLQLRPLMCLEVGSGAGVVSTFLAKMIGNSAMYLTTDLNPAAADVTKRTSEQNCIVLQPLIMDLAGGLLSRLRGQVDVLIFNPPYVVTPSDEVGKKGIEASWAGGRKGREVIDRFLPQVAELLSVDGLFYLVIIKENDKDEIEQIMTTYGLQMVVVLERRSGPERLSILRFSKTSSS